MTDKGDTTDLGTEITIEEVALDNPSIGSEEYASLKDDFAQIIDRGMKGFQEKTKGRILDNVTIRLQGRHGFIVQTNDRGLIEIPEMSGVEVDNQGRSKKQRMFMGMNASVTTKGTTFGSVNLLRRGETTIKEFEANATAYELLKACIERAQKKGEERQRKIEEEGSEYWDRAKTDIDVKYISCNFDQEPIPSIDQVFGLISLARQTLKAELGAKIVESTVIFFYIMDTMEITDSQDKRIDYAAPRTGIAILAKTDKGNTIIESIRGTGGMRAITREDQTKTPEQAVEGLAKLVSKYCKDIDRAQSCSSLGGEAYVLMSGNVSGVLAHEVYGHPSESDIIVENRRDENAELNLKSRIGSQVSENRAFNIIDEGNFVIQIGDKTVEHCFGGTVIDVDGLPSKRTSLVTEGIQTLVMNSADTFSEIAEDLPEPIGAGLVSHGLSGNTRNERFDKRPLVRMTNTFILPSADGPKSVEAMATEIPPNKKGVYLVTCGGGWVNTDSGDFEVTGELGYLIENGTITDKPIKDLVVRGNITKFGNKIKSVGSSETLLTGTGYCGKNGQWVPVELGGPALLIKDAAVGADVSVSYWLDTYEEYSRQTREMICGKRKPKEIFLRFVDEAIETKKASHEGVCLLAMCLPLKDEAELLIGTKEETTEYVLSDSGKLEVK